MAKNALNPRPLSHPCEDPIHIWVIRQRRTNPSAPPHLIKLLGLFALSNPGICSLSNMKFQGNRSMVSPDKFRTGLAIAMAILGLWVAPAQAQESLWMTASTGVGVYARIGTNNFLVDLLPAGLEQNAYSTSIAIGRTLTKSARRFAWEVEGQAVQHFGRQSHWELDGAFLFRWLEFPWNGEFKTSLAIGDGLSLASKTSAIEARRNLRTSKLLNFLVIEGTITSPAWSSAHLVLRLNHRSGVYGLFNGVSAGSNFVSLGIRVPL